MTAEDAEKPEGPGNAQDVATPAERAILEQVGRVDANPGVLGWFLGPEAAAAADEVRAGVMLPDGRARAPAVYALAYHHWCRYLAADANDPAALGDALLCFSGIHENAPEEVPPALRPVLATLYDEPDGAGTDPGHAYEAAVGLMTLYQARRHTPILVAAERLLRHAVAGFPVASTDQGTCLSNLGLVRLYAFQEGAGYKALAEAVEHSRAAVAAAPGPQAEQSRRRGNLGLVLRHWAEATSDTAATRESLSELRLAMRLSTPEDPHHTVFLGTLGSALSHAAARLDDADLLPEAVDLLRQSVAASDPAGPPHASHLADLGTALVMLALADNRPELYGEGVETCRRAADAAPNPVERAMYLTNLGLVLRSHWTRSGDPGALDDAEEAVRAAVAALPPGHPTLTKAVFVLSGVLRARHVASGRLADMAEAVALARQALDATPARDLSQRAARGTELADLQRLYALAAGTPGALDEPLALLRGLEQELAEPSAERARVLFALARCLEHAGRGGDASAVAGDGFAADDGAGPGGGAHGEADEAIDRFRECLALPLPQGGFEAEVRFAFGTALTRRARSGDQAAWRQATDQMRQGLALLDADDSRRSEYLSDFAAICSRRATTTGDIALHEEAVRLCREAAACVPAGSPSEGAVRRSNLGATLATVARRTGDAGLLAEAVQAHRDAVTMTPAEDHYRVHRLGNLGDALQNLAEILSDPSLLEEAITALREAVSASAANTPGRADCLTRLGHALRSLSRFTGDPAPLEEAVRVHRKAVAAFPAAPPPRALVGLANSLSDRYQHTREARLRDEAVELLHAARAAVPDGSDDKSAVLTSLGHLEWGRARDSGLDTLMDEALATLRDAAAAVASEHVGHGMALTNLAMALMERSQLSGDRTWQAEAVAVLRRALAETPRTSFERATRLSNLAAALRGWYAISEDPAAADEAAALLREASSIQGGEHIGPELAELNLGVLLYSRAVTDQDPQGAAEARRVLEEALATLGDGHPRRAFGLSNLAIACLGCVQLADDKTGPAAREALHRAVTAAREALTRMPEDSPDQPSTLWILAEAQVRRAELGEPVDLAETARLARRAAQSPVTPVMTRLLAARAWGEAAAKAGRNADALEGYAYAVGLLPRTAPRGLGRADQEERLQASSGLASDAAAMALRAGDPGRALALLEEGRGVLLAQGLDNHGEVSRLRDLAPALAGEFERIRDQLSVAPQPAAALVTDPGSPGPLAGAPGLATEVRHALARRWDQLIEEIRALPGLSDFLRPPDLPELLTAAAEGPVVVVNVSTYRSDALVVTADAGIEVVPLPGLSPTAVLSRVAVFLECVDRAYGSEGVQHAVAAMGVLTQTLRWLWDTVTAPVLDRLGLRGVPIDDEPWTRLWWCPTGWLSFLPLHAAGRGAPDSGRWVVDRAVSSYTPTLRALVRARRQLDRVSQAPPGPAPLVVALNEVPGAEPLPGSEHEAAVLAELFPGARLLTGADATVAAVRRALPAHSWVHFSCHGVSDMLNPSASGLLLYDGRLTALDIAVERPARPQLAVLSACSTSQGGLALPDEAVQLASSFQLAGYPHVIGTLWTVPDELATALAEEFYAVLAEDLSRGRPIDPATALHHPVRALRDRYAKAPHLWAAHIHTGP
ncbi:CHAT domain-containing protein [Streptomyces sp. RB6PN25]|uniref:CHAT domain-containing protein n=1 Tax=Streptomyces humicola TaxID=2953240 RepID=A0ABT1PWI9_9ACTN|nr:CHAT domain-containing protein [Streptomyces humicola]MCQ4080932.1 CHAT domain-containing protein [Streptomyces humicola]